MTAAAAALTTTAPTTAVRPPRGHAQARQWLANAYAKGRLGGSVLLVGPPGIGKAALAKWVAQGVFCQSPSPAANDDATAAAATAPVDATAADKNRRVLAPCGRCPACSQVAADTHPDLVQVRKPEDRAFIPLDLLIGPPEARMQSGFCRDIRLRPFQGGGKVAILHDADHLNEEGANSLLKTLEEPPPSTVIFLIGTSEQRQLPTIRSRSQIVRLQPPQGDDAVQLMADHGVTVDAAAAEQAIELCGGDCLAAVQLLSGQAAGLHGQLRQLLDQATVNPVQLARLLTESIDELGKSASGSVKRDRLRDLFSLAVHIYRGRLRDQADQGDRLSATVYRLDRSIDAIEQVHRNANQATLIEAWAADVARGFPA